MAASLSRADSLAGLTATDPYYVIFFSVALILTVGKDWLSLDKYGLCPGCAHRPSHQNHRPNGRENHQI